MIVSQQVCVRTYMNKCCIGGAVSASLRRSLSQLGACDSAQVANKSLSRDDTTMI